MKSYWFLASFAACALLSAQAQMPGMGGPRGSHLSGNMAKLFGANSAFSATMEVQAKSGPAADTMTVPGKLAFDAGQSRFEMDMSDMKGGKMPPDAAAHMKSMGMDKMIMISRPDKKLTYLIYPGLKAYVESPMQGSEASQKPEDYKLQITELGKETVDGHPCIKNKAVVTDKNGKTFESTVWNATDLKQFPVKIEQTEQGTEMTMLFKDIQLSKPEAGKFEAPSDFAKHASPMELMQQSMMKRFGGPNGGMPPGHPPVAQPKEQK